MARALNRSGFAPPFSKGSGRPIDPGIAREVRVLSENGVETFESCQGGSGHTFPEPTVRFHGDHAEGFRALSVALRAGLKVDCLRRYWQMEERQPSGPHWEMTFREKTIFGGRKKPGQ